MPTLLSPESFGVLLYLALRFFSVSGAALALFMGKFLLAAILVAIALGISIRLWRKPVKRSA